MTILALLSLAGQFLVIVTIFYLSIIIHELGHLLAALIVGWKPLVMTIGTGKKKPLFRIREVSFVFGAKPSGGLMQSVARRIDYWRLKQFIYVLGGPVATSCILVSIYYVGFLSALPAWWYSPLSIFFALEACILIGCLFPHKIQMDGKLIPNDGLLMWKTVTIDKSHVPIYFASHAKHLASFLMGENKLAEARKVFASGFSHWLDAFGTQLQWVRCLLEVGQYKLAISECEELLAIGNKFDKSRAEALDGIASIPVFHNHPEMLDDAMRYINLAIEEASDTITLKGTRASLLIEQGSLDEGMQLLDEVIQKSESKNDQAICKYYMALAWYKKGEVNKAYEHLRLAQAIDPNCMVHQKIEDQIAGKITSSRNGH